MSSNPSAESLDILAIAAHRDDVEQTCGGTILKSSQLGQRTGILDLTKGEMGTRGSAADRENEANDAAKILGVVWRQALDIPDGRVENTVGKPAEGCQSDSRNAAAGGHPALLEGTASGSLHGVDPGIRSLLSRRDFPS